MASLGALVIELAANTARLQSDLGKAVGMAQAAAGRFNTVFRGVAALAGAGSLGAVVTKSIEIGDSLNKAAIKAGITGTAMSELAHAAKMSDVELGALSTSLRVMQTNLSKAAEGAKEPTESLAALGLQIGELRALSADRQFELLGDRISRLKEPADRARAATELFGRAGADLLPLFEEGARGIRAAREEAQKLGQSFTDRQLKNLAQADDSAKRLKASWEGFATALVSKASPALSFFLDLLHGELPKANLETRIATLKYSIAALEGTTVANGIKKLAELRGELALLEEQLNPYEDFAARRSRAMSGAGNAPGYAPQIEAENTLTEVIVTASRIRIDAMDAYYERLNEETQSSTERQIADLNRIESGLNELLAAGKITAKQFNERWSEALGKVVHEVEVTAKRIGDTATKQRKEFTETALQFAEDSRYAVQKFFFEPTQKGFRGLAKDLVDNIRWAVAKLAAEKLFNPKGKGGLGWGDALSGGFDIASKFLGFASGGSFKVGGSGGTDSQLVAFRATPGEMVDVRTPGQSGRGVVFAPVYNIDARGASAGVVPALTAELNRRDARLKADMANLINGGAFIR